MPWRQPARLGQIVRLIHAVTHAYATREGVARRAHQAGKGRAGWAAPCDTRQAGDVHTNLQNGRAHAGAMLDRT